MEITDIVSGRDEKLHVYIDDEYRFSTTAERCYRNGLHTGDEITEEEIQEYEREYEFARAKSRAMTLLTNRDHSCYELEQKLLKNFGEPAVEYALDEMERLGYIDDLNFAQRLARELYLKKHWAQRRIEWELRSRGVDAEIIAEAVGELDYDDMEALIAVIEKKYSLPFESEKERRRAVNALSRLGYGIREIFQAFDSLE